MKHTKQESIGKFTNDIEDQNSSLREEIKHL